MKTKKIIIGSLLTLAIAFVISNCQTAQPQLANNVLPKKERLLNLCGPTTADLNTAPGKDGKLSPIFPGLDVYHFPISTESRLAQKYFDQGYVWNFGFNHAEAARSFREAIRQDPECATCYWGLAYVLGPNYNAVMEEDVLSAANEATANAKLYMHKVSRREQALIKAIDKRYPKQKGVDPTPYYEAYAQAMKEAMQQFPDDLDIAVMTAEALMDLHPWQIWKPDGTEQPWTREIVDIIESVLARNPDHPQAMHLYVHAVEASKNPAVALAAAKNLEYAVPGAGHLLHMPSHLYIRTGHYHDGTLANERAVKIDSNYVEACSEAGIYPLAYYPHNWHFLAACAALEGKGKRALEASRVMANYVGGMGDVMRDPALATLQHYYSIPWFIMVKFAMWEDIAEEAPPATDLLYPTAIWRYAKGMAYAKAGDFAKAEKCLNVIKEIEKDEAVQQMSIWEINTISDVLSIARYVLQGQIAKEKGELSSATLYFQQAIAIEDQLNYNEPPDWFFSVRHLLGNILLEDEKFELAEKVYKEDLERLPKNGWARAGLQKSLEAQDKNTEALLIQKQFNRAWQWADQPLTTSVLQ